MPERIPQSVAKRVALKAYLAGTTTPATGKTIAITISKNGGAYANPSAGATNATEISNGSYYVDLSTTDTATTGPLMVIGIASGVDNVDAIFTVADPHNAGFDGIPSATAAANGGLPTVDANNNIHGVQPGTGTGQLNPSSGKVPATLASTDVTGNVAADLQTIKTQTVTCGAGVTVYPSVGAANELLVDGSGFVTYNNAAPPTGAAIATAIFQDTTSGDFTVAGSIGLSLFTGHAPGASSGIALVGSNVGSATSVSGTVGGIAGTTQTLDALQTALSSTHGAGPWATATGFSVPGDAMTLTSGGYDAAADALLGRNIAGGSSTGRIVSEALYTLRNKVVISGTTMTVYSTDDTTSAWTAALTTDGSATPITSVDPT